MTISSRNHSTDSLGGTITPGSHDTRADATTAFPLVVDLDGTFLRIDTLYELFTTGLFTKPLQTLLCLTELRHGIAAFKRRLSDLVALDVETLPVRDELLAYLNSEAMSGREIHLATAADQNIAKQIAERFSLFKTVQGTEQGHNLKGSNKAQRLIETFPGGYSYAGDSWADLPVWKSAKTAVVASNSRSLQQAVRSAGIAVEHVIGGHPQRGPWIKAIRPHQWVKNLVVFVPMVLGWRYVTPASLLATIAMAGLLCVVASLTYLVNDIADLSADRRHWSKRRRPFASGAIPVRDGLLVAGIGLPLACAAALLISPPAGAWLLLYVVITLGYSFGWKRIPVFDAFVIATLFTIRILIGIAAAAVMPSAWLLTFSMFFFFSLALAKRHTEILRAQEHGAKKLDGRDYQIEDASLTLVLGISAAMASIVIVVIYLVEEVFLRQVYATPAWLWATPIAIFLFVCRIWVLSHRGRMTDDPVAFALRDRVSVLLGLLTAIALVLAL